MTNSFTCKPVGDCALLAVFEQSIAPQIAGQVASLNRALKSSAIHGILETVPAYASLMIYYDPLLLDYNEAVTAVEQAAAAADDEHAAAGRLVEVPVCYGGEYGPDLPYVAAHAGLTESEVIDLHCSVEYLIYMLGFLPGFPYLGGLDERLHTPRLSTPRTAIPAGSVGIGGSQTGIYPIASPGGWQLIGRTPLRLFDPDGDGQLPYAAGDRIRFVPITGEEFEELSLH